MTEFPNGESPEGAARHDYFPEYDGQPNSEPGYAESGDAVVADADAEPDIEDGLPAAERPEPRYYTQERVSDTGDASDRAAALAVGRTVEMVDRIDPALLDNPEARQLVRLGAATSHEVTEKFGTTEHPKVVSGTHEKEVFMVYHNGGDDGHTSVGEQGAGVPRNVLTIARAVNEAAGEEVYTVADRAAVFYAAAQHDKIQLCGRTLLPEGTQGPDYGDERLSAEDARGQLLVAGVSPEKTDEVADLVIATAWNPNTNTQNVRREELDPRNPYERKILLNRELIACGDLLSPSSERGVLGTIEYAAERLCLVQNGQIMQHRLDELGVDPATVETTHQLMDVIGNDPVLHKAFTDILAGDPVFYADHLRYEDDAIRQATGGRGIDELFPGRRLANAAALALNVMRLKEGALPADIWLRARRGHGY